MPRAGGVYTLPAGNPVVTLTLISSSWANTTLSDMATALTGSVPTDGSAPMTGPLRLPDGSVGAPALSFSSESTSGWYRIGVNSFGFSNGGVLCLSVNSNRQWTIPASVAGATLTVGGTSAIITASFNGINLGLNVGLSGSGSNIYAGGNVAIGSTTAATLGLYTNSVLRLNIASGGAISLTPTTGVALTLNSVAAQVGIQINPADSASVGLQISDPGGAGTTVSLSTANGSSQLSSNTRIDFTINGHTFQGLTDGSLGLSNAGGGPTGLGTINALGYFIAGLQIYSGLPQTAKAGNYTIAIVDQNTCISNTGAAAVNTIPANASIAFPIGACVSFWNNSAGNQTIAITTDSLRWNTPFVTGTRTLAANGFATAIKMSATIWLLTGNGIS